MKTAKILRSQPGTGLWLF